MITGREVVEIVVPRMVAAVGEQRTRALHQLVLEQLGEGGSVADWLRAWGTILAADDDTAGQDALLAAIADIERLP